MNQDLLPLIFDLTNPSPGLGWSNTERKSFKDRELPNSVLALALIHHMAISNNLPFDKIAKFFSDICRHLVIEFVDKNDSQVQKLLSTRKDIFSQYNQETFENVFSKYFNVIEKKAIEGTYRTMYLMTKKEEL